MKSYVLGADPGKNGGIVLLDINCDINNVKQSDLVLIPFKDKSTDEFDILSLYNKLLPYKDSIKFYLMEQIHAIFGSSAASTFTFGEMFGSLKSILTILANDGKANADVRFISPKVWQSQVWKTSHIVWDCSKAKRKKDTKATSLNAALDLYPNVSFVMPRCKKPHDGLVDAALIAHCALNYYMNSLGSHDLVDVVLADVGEKSSPCFCV